MRLTPRKEAVLDMWREGHPTPWITACSGFGASAVHGIVAAARRAGDDRAVHRCIQRGKRIIAVERRA